MKITKSCLSVLLCLVMLGMLFTASAVGLIDTTQAVELNISLSDNGTGIPDAEFEIYHIANVSESGKYTLTDEFAQSSVDFDENIEDWQSVALTFTGYVYYNNIEAYDSAYTDEQGVAAFPNKTVNMEQGLYLVMPVLAEYNGTEYIVEPYVVALPDQDTENNQWVYTVDSIAKYTTATLPISCDVTKVWEDDEYTGYRPESIEVYLMKDDEVYDTVTLSEDNNWSYSWQELDGDSYWSVAEACPKEYKCSVDRTSNSFVITNTLTGDIPQEPQEKLPQTGMLQWPIPLLIAGGLVLIIIGVVIRRGRKNAK